jgi:hypothetical protein
VETGSPFGGEIQPGKVPLHRIRQGLIPPPPPIKSGLGGFMLLSQVIRTVNPDSKMPVTEGLEGNLPVQT